MERSRIVIAFAIAVAPIAGVIGVGCSDDETPKVGMTSVDPGGVFGAEIAVRVVGRGRVTGSIPTSIDCPGDCYARYTFTSESDKGAADGITLKAIATEGVRFVGWTFENEQLGTKARGPDNCSPVKRGTSQPGDSDSPDLKLSFGKTTGTAPPGQEGSCVGDLLEVPVAYKLVARFEDIPVIDAGPDVGDGGDGGSPGTVLFEAPAVGATGGELFIIGNRLYWKYTASGVHGIATGLTSSPNNSAPLVVVSPSSTIPRFEGDQYNVTFQTSGGVLGVFNASNPTAPVTGFSSAPTCDAVESYSTSLLYCLSAGTLYSWPITGGAPTVVTSTVPATTGRNFGVTSSYFWVVNDPGTTGTATLQRLSKSITDGGAQTWENNIITGRTNPVRLLVTPSFEYLAWLELNTPSDFGEVRASSGSSTVYNPIVAENGLRFLAPDSTGSQIIAGVAPSSGAGGKIYRTSITSSPGVQITPSVTEIPNLTGIAADASYFYWTQNDGRVYRRLK